MKRFKEFKDQGILTIFDIDETLFHTTAHVIVRGPGGVIRRKLNNREFNDYKPKPDDTLDFSEFKDADLFYETSRPIRKMFNRIKLIMRMKKNPNSKVIILTARSDFDNKDKFLATFRKHGLTEIDEIHVHRAGNLTGYSAAEAKRIYIEQYLKTGKFYKARLFDDSESNLKMFNRLRLKYSTIEFDPWQVVHNGDVRSYKYQ
jgi:hypothetical protein